MKLGLFLEGLVGLEFGVDDIDEVVLKIVDRPITSGNPLGAFNAKNSRFVLGGSPASVLENLKAATSELLDHHIYMGMTDTTDDVTERNVITVLISKEDYADMGNWFVIESEDNEDNWDW